MAKTNFIACPYCKNKIPTTSTKCFHCNSHIPWDYTHGPSEQEIDDYISQMTDDDKLTVMLNCWEKHFEYDYEEYGFTKDDYMDYKNYRAYINHKKYLLVLF